MKKIIVIAVAALIGIGTTWADATNVLFKLDIRIVGKLIPAGRVVTGQDLSGNTNAISHLDLQIVHGTTTQEVAVIGQLAVVGSTTNVLVLLQEVAHVDLPPLTKTGYKFVHAFSGSAGLASNAMFLVFGAVKIDKATNETITAALEGIWTDGAQAIEGTVTTVKERPLANLTTVARGNDFTIQLAANPTTGYGWQLAHPLDERIVKLVSEVFQGPSPTNGLVLVGQGGTEIWTFQALHVGETTIALKYVPAWMRNVPPTFSTNFTIKVQ